jgi:hypothetical protein
MSDTTPTWIDITPYFLEGYYRRGHGVLANPEAGVASLLLDNRDRRLEPEHAAGAYYPDIKPLPPAG